MNIRVSQDYLLLIDEESKLVKGDYLLEKDAIINVFPDYLTDLDDCVKILAYYPLNEKAEELELPFLPNPSEIESLSVDSLKSQTWGTTRGLPYNEGYLVGFKEACKLFENKNFTLNDMINAFDEGANNGSYHESMCGDYDNLEEIGEAGKYAESNRADFIQLLKERELPKEFIPTIETYKNSDNGKWEFGGYDVPDKEILKIITNSQGKRELVGNYKY